MTTKWKRANQRAANREIHSVLVPLPEQELMRLLKSVKALRKDLPLIFPSAHEPAPAVSAAHDLLKTWNDALERILGARQAKEINRRLRNWDNEGGAVDHARKQHSLSRTAS